MQKILIDIAILRPIAILLLIIYHAFIIYMGGWDKPMGYADIEPYKWIAILSYGTGFLRLFVLMSGYIMGLQLFSRNKKTTLKSIIISKGKRLIIPSIVFGIIYFLMFYDYSTILSATITILSGCGHLWFLPMLFWCFIWAYLIMKIKCKERYKLIFLALITPLGVLPIPFGIGDSLSYIFFFYLGILIYKNRSNILCINKWGGVILFIILFMAIFLSYQLYFPSIQSNDIVIKAILILLKQYIILIYSAIGCLFAYQLVNKLTYGKEYAPKWLVYINSICMGIYIFQQFILQYIYYKTTIPQIVGPYWLPWFGTIVTIIFSIGFTIIIRQFKIGKFLIG